MATAVVNQPAPVAGVDGQALNSVTAVHNSSLYVGDVDKDVTEAQLYELFASVSNFSEVADASRAITRIEKSRDLL